MQLTVGEQILTHVFTRRCINVIPRKEQRDRAKRGAADEEIKSMSGEKRQIMIGIIHNVMVVVIDDGRKYISFLFAPSENKAKYIKAY